jgi:hypothetical protein
MTNTSLQEEKAAHLLFKNSAIATLEKKSGSAFKEALRQKVLDSYMTNITTHKRMSYQPLFKKIALFGFVAILVIGAYFAGTTALKLPLISKQIGLELTFAEGKIEYQRNGQWFTATTETPLQQGDTIKVAENGKAILNLDDGSTVRLNAESSVVLTSLNPKNIVITNTSGEVYARVAKSTTRTFVVSANGVEYKAMGTAYRVTEDTLKKGVDVFASSVEVMQNGTKTTVEQGKKYYVVDKNSPTTERTISQIDKTEDLNNDAFIKWNVACDETDPEGKEDLGIFKDTEAPALSVKSPANGGKTTSSQITVAGKTEAGSTVYVNGAKVDNNGGEFSKKLNLSMGYNTITVKAIDAAGNSAKVVVKIKRESPPAPKPTPKPAPSVYLSLYSISAGKVGWKVVGFTSENGFKIVWSKASGPTYPTRSSDEYIYNSAESARSQGGLSAFDGAGYYYVRVCEYLGGKCGRYSNQIKIYLD